MQTELLGYLLNALEEEEARCVEQLLEADIAAQRQLDILRLSLIPLGSREAHDEPATDLAERTCILLREIRRTHS